MADVGRSLAVTIADQGIADLVALPLDELTPFSGLDEAHGEGFVENPNKSANVGRSPIYRTRTFGCRSSRNERSVAKPFDVTNYLTSTAR